MAKSAIFANFAIFFKIIKFSKCGALTYYDPCNPKSAHVLLYVLPIPRKHFHVKMPESEFGTQDLKVYSHYYDVAYLLYNGNIDAKFEEPTTCSY